MLDESWINMKRVRTWPKYCDKSHGGTCHSVENPWLKVDPPSRLLLIDTEHKCLVYKPGSCQYLALSYIWGITEKPFQTMLDNFSDLRQKGAFDAPRYRSRLPETIRDSMSLTRLLNQRYLWVDRFCIVQDDFAQKAEQLKWMASIYANAYITIIASDGNSDSYGLRGIGKGSSPRVCHLGDFNFGPRCRMTCRFIWKSQEKKYETRGWTFQEKAVSTRQLIFKDNMVSWRCRNSSWDENIVGPIAASSDWGNYAVDLFSRWPNLSHYTKMVKHYNDRQLTYPGDGLEAFSAITTIISRSMRGGTLFGLPEMFFDGTLLWQPDSPWERRKDATGMLIRNLPSWSWAGWAGYIDVRIWDDGHNFIKKTNDTFESIHTPYLVIDRIIEWHKVNIESGERDPIQNSYYETSRMTKGRRKVQPQNKILPDGWNFRHHVLVAREPLSPNEDVWSPILEFRAHRLFLTVGDAISDKQYSSDCVSAGLIDRSGSIVGGFRVNSSNMDDIPTGQTCELIAISKAEADWMANGSSLKRNFPEATLFHKDCPHSCQFGGCKGEKIYRFYNVLWIEWEDGIAYRKALGRVFQDFWDSEDTEEIDIRLG
jgi:hypothetical protein